MDGEAVEPPAIYVWRRNDTSPIFSPDGKWIAFVRE